MVHEVLSPGVEDSNRADLTQALPCEFDQRFRGSPEEGGIENLLVSQGKGVELFREGKDDMEVGDRKKLLLPCLKPLLFP